MTFSKVWRNSRAIALELYNYSDIYDALGDESVALEEKYDCHKHIPSALIWIPLWPRLHRYGWRSGWSSAIRSLTVRSTATFSDQNLLAAEIIETD
jgi:hypothetical protein